MRVADPDAGCELRDVAAEPGVDVVLGRSGLAGDRAADRGAGPGSFLGHRLERVGDLVGDLLRDGGASDALPERDDLPGGGTYRVDGLGLVAYAPVGQRRVGDRHLERTDRLCAQGD